MNTQTRIRDVRDRTRRYRVTCFQHYYKEALKAGSTADRLRGESLEQK